MKFLNPKATSARANQSGLPPKLRVVIHDYSGHPFQIQLSRCLANRGHQIFHLYSGSINTPRGPIEPREGDPNNLAIEMIALDSSLKKYSYFTRRRQELNYGNLLSKRIKEISPDIVVASNTPIDILRFISDQCDQSSIQWILWLQDIYSIAIARYATKKLPLIGHLAARYYAWQERQMFQRCSRIVAISEDFSSIIKKLGTPKEKISVIENWAPIDEIVLRTKNNSWSKRNGLTDKFCFLYSGTLGLKHNPDLLIALAKHFQGNSKIRIVVVSEGIGADYLSNEKESQDLGNLVLLPWQPFELLSDVLGTADVLLTILELEAGPLSVPSKVLSNMCAGKAQLLAVPPENLAARIVIRENSGFVVSPNDRDAWLESAETLFENHARRLAFGTNGRSYAERTFDIEKIANKFEQLFVV